MAQNQADTETGVQISVSVIRRLGLILIVAFAAISAWLKWGKMETLIYGDPALWLNEVGRYAHGELPYRDFYWPYGPLSEDFLAWPLRWFGARFEVAQAVMDILSAAVVALVYKIASRLVPPLLATSIAIWTIAVGVTARTYFGLFSLVGYAPSLHVAGAGLLLMMWALVDYLNDGRMPIVRAAFGAWLACLGKQETLVCALVVFTMLAWFDQRLFFKERSRRLWLAAYTRWSLIFFLPPALVYAIWGVRAGWTKLIACLGGFGLATMSCPWWPTGFGSVGILVELGEAWILLTLATLFVPDWRIRVRFLLGGNLLWAWLLAFAALAGTVAFHWNSYADILQGPGSISARLQRDLTDLLATAVILRPFLIACYAYAAAILVSRIMRSALAAIEVRDLLLVVIPCIMGLRSLFGTTLFSNSLEAPAISFPFLLLMGPYLLYSALTNFGRRTALESNQTEWRAAAFAFTLLIAYSAIRIVGGYPAMLSSAQFTPLDTPNGRIYLREYPSDKPVYDFVLAHSAPTDTLLELPYGGGLSFATGRRQPTYSTLFDQLRPPDAIQQEDLERFTAHPPPIVVASRDPNFGTRFGIAQNVGCACPRLVWLPDAAPIKANYLFPVVDYIQRNYQVSLESGRWIVLTRR